MKRKMRKEGKERRRGERGRCKVSLPLLLDGWLVGWLVDWLVFCKVCPLKLPSFVIY